MPTLFQTLEATLARGAEGLSADARAELAAALTRLRGADGGFAGLDGRSDPYFTLFAWLCLRGLGVSYDRAALCAYLSGCPCRMRTVDSLCADFVLSVEVGARRKLSLEILAAVLRGDVYSVFLASAMAGKLPAWIARAAVRRLSLHGVQCGLPLQPTPRLAARVALASWAEADASAVVAALRGRRLPSGGYASAAGAAPDLLATAAARFACGLASVSLPAHERAGDLAFVEACWSEDGLFGPSPVAPHGDSEHTFYGLLALGTCR